MGEIDVYVLTVRRPEGESVLAVYADEGEALGRAREMHDRWVEHRASVSDAVCRALPEWEAWAAGPAPAAERVLRRHLPGMLESAVSGRGRDAFLRLAGGAGHPRLPEVPDPGPEAAPRWQLSVTRARMVLS